MLPKTCFKKVILTDDSEFTKPMYFGNTCKGVTNKQSIKYAAHALCKETNVECIPSKLRRHFMKRCFRDQSLHKNHSTNNQFIKI